MSTWNNKEHAIANKNFKKSYAFVLLTTMYYIWYDTPLEAS